MVASKKKASVSLNPCAKRERGSVMLETAIALPLVLLLVFGFVDIGNMTTKYWLLSNIGQNGYRSTVYTANGSSTDESKIKSAIQDLLDAQVMDANEPQVEIIESAAPPPPPGTMALMSLGPSMEEEQPEPERRVRITTSRNYTTLLGGFTVTISSTVQGPL